jgi:regulator of cell morphogenesis and NO signaling
MDNHWMDRTVGGIVVEIPEAARIFSQSGIDFCCGGSRLLSEAILADAATDRPIDTAALDAALDAAVLRVETLAGTSDFRTLSTDALMEHIEARHHAYIKEALPEISERLAIVLRAHGQHHSELFQVHGVFGQVRTDLEQHLVKEEVLLFPALSRGTPDDATRALAQTLRDEHTAVGEMLRTLRRLNHDYVAPEDACPTYRRLLKELETMEADLFQHIHLENNILLQGV